MQGTRVNAVHDLSYITTHSFREDQEWVVEVVLFASEECTESFFKRNHRKNKGKVAEIGRVEFDLRHMKYVIQQTNLSNEMLENSVEIRVEMRVIDRNIEFAAFFGQPLLEARRFADLVDTLVWLRPSCQALSSVVDSYCGCKAPPTRPAPAGCIEFCRQVRHVE